MSTGYSMYNQVNINSTSPNKIILMLYDACINFTKKAIEYTELNDIKNKNIYANKAREIIVGFNDVLNMDAGGEIATNLRSLYLFLNPHLMEANWHNDTEKLNEVVKLMSNLRDAWEDAYNQETGIAIQEKTFGEKPWAGLMV